jgi:hypothetical protein
MLGGFKEFQGSADSTVYYQIPNLRVTGSNPVGVANFFNALFTRRETIRLAGHHTVTRLGS